MGFFNMENKFFQAMGQLADAFILSVLWLLFCIPVVTAGASTTALFYTAHKVLRRQQGYLWSAFWGAFKSNFKQSTIIGLVYLAVFLLLSIDWRITNQMGAQNPAYGAASYFFLVLMLFLTVWGIYTFAYTARFELGVAQTMKNGVLLLIAHFPWSLLIMVIFLVSLAIVFLVMPLFILIVPTGAAALYDIILDRIFRKYMSEEDLKREEELDMLER